MILTITYTQPPATDLGYLLYKNPSRPQTFELNHGKAHIFYPEVTKERCTAALILDMDPIDLARGKKGSSGEGGLFDYVNDRPYVASSFLSVAMSRVFGTAMSGKSKDRPELAEKALPFQAKIMMLPCRGEEGIIHRLFEPLGYKVTVEGYMLDEEFPEWGKSKYYTVILEGMVKLQDLLNHIYVLIPVLDSEKHYWVGEDEIEKLLRHGEGWLTGHPEKSLITGRYLKRKRSLINQALERLVEDSEEVKVFIDGLVSHYVLDNGNLVVAHAGMKEELQGRGSGKVREFALYGETTGETDEYGLPVRYDWASDYRGKATVVYGHTPQAEILKTNNTINIDTGCVFGGKLTAYRYPEREFMEVKALKTYYEPAKPFLPEEDKADGFEARGDNDLLDINDVLGKRIIGTRLYNNITIQEENSIAALEVMSRFAADPHWLIYLPPTMSPSETSKDIFPEESIINLLKWRLF